MSQLILEICRDSWWEPRQLAELLGRHPKYIIATFLKPLSRDGHLIQRYPANKHHPKQAYRTQEAGSS